MRASIPFLVLLLATTASCGQPEQQQPMPSTPSEPPPSYEQATNDVASIAADAGPPASRRAAYGAGPNVGPTAAPGVAFNYRYAFRLAAPRVAEVQEQHAQMCERLGVRQCRITGMLYRVVNNRDIQAQLAFKLDPAIARRFGREGVEAVTRAEGMLTESEITGIDAGAAIQAAGRGIAELEAELARVEARIRAAGRNDKTELEYQAQQLREQIRTLRQSRETQQASLATTPMVFNYGSGSLVPGFAPPPTLEQTIDDAGEDFMSAVYLLLRILIVVLPWALTAALLGWLFSLARRRWFPSRPKAAVPESPEAA